MISDQLLQHLLFSVPIEPWCVVTAIDDMEKYDDLCNFVWQQGFAVN